MKRKTAALIVLLALLTAAPLWIFRRSTDSNREEAKPSVADVIRTSANAPHRISSEPGEVPAFRRQLGDGPLDPEGPLLLEGQVLDSDDQPVPGAVVLLDARPRRETTTGEDGTFSFNKLIGRTYSLSARTSDQVGGPVISALSESSDPVIIRLSEGANLRVEVVRADSGRPVAGARVGLLDSELVTATTGADGRALLANLPAGLQVISADADGLVPQRQLVSMPSSPGTTIDQRLVLDRGVRVTGQVIGPDGTGVSGARVVARATDTVFDFFNPREHGVTSDADGQFAIAAAPLGSHRLSAVHDDYAPGESDPIAITEDVAPVTIRLGEGATVSGSVVNTDGSAARWAEIEISSPDGAERHGSRQAIADDSGKFRVTGLAREKVEVRASSDRASSRAIDVDLAGGAQVRDLVLRLDVVGTIAGRVVNEAGEPVAEAQLMALPDFWKSDGGDRDHRNSAAFATSNGDGHFLLRGLTEGAFRVHVSTSAQPFARLGTGGTPAITGQQDLVVVLATPGSIVGRVQFADGETPAIATVSTGWGEKVPVAGGAFRVDNLQPGSYGLDVRGIGFPDKSVTNVAVQAGEATDVGTVTLERGRDAHGLVLDDSGKPVAGATVVLGTQIMSSGSKLTDDNFASILSDQFGIRSVQSDEHGQFRINGIGDGELVAVAEHPELGRSMAHSIPKSSEDVELELVLGRTGSLSGVVTQGGEPLQAAVMVSPAEGAKQLALVQTGSDGGYQIERVAPGQLRLTVVKGTGFTGSVEMFSETVTVEPGTAAVLNIDVPPGEITLVVQIASKSAPQLENAQVFVMDGVIKSGSFKEFSDHFLGKNSARSMRMAMMTGGGPVELRELAPGRYSVCVIPLPGDLNDPNVARQMQDNSEEMNVTCRPITVAGSPTRQTVQLEVEMPGAAGGA